MGSPECFWVVEPGSGTGVLAHDILESLEKTYPKFRESIRYTTVDLGTDADQLSTNADHIESNTLPFANIQGCVIANELLDALPFHRVTQKDGQLREIMVTVDRQGKFVETIESLSTPALQDRLTELNINLPNGYRTEINLLLQPWLEKISTILTRGYLLLIDYGHEASTLYSDSRSRGTLRCYFRHTLNANPYQNVSKQDISCHVDFTSVKNIARSEGLIPIGYSTQKSFLKNLGWGAFRDALINETTLSIAQQRSNAIAMERLISPDGMGEFKVLALSKGMEETVPSGFADAALSENRHPIDPLPLLSQRHIPPIPWATDEVNLPSWEDLLA